MYMTENADITGLTRPIMEKVYGQFLSTESPDAFDRHLMIASLYSTIPAKRSFGLHLLPTPLAFTREPSSGSFPDRWPRPLEGRRTSLRETHQRSRKQDQAHRVCDVTSLGLLILIASLLFTRYPGVPHGHHMLYENLSASKKFNADFNAGFQWLLSGAND